MGLVVYEYLFFKSTFSLVDTDMLQNPNRLIFSIVIKNDNQLILQIPEQGKVPLLPRSQNYFFINGSVYEFTFNINEAGEVESMTMHPDGGDDVICKKIED